MKINKDKRIGRVLFIVEGSRYEFNLLKQIFCELLQYEYIEKRRNNLDKFINGKDRYSRIAVINTKESNIADISNNDDYLDTVFDILREEYQFPVDKSAIYYLFDRDPESNTDAEKIREYIRTLKNPYENDNELKAGQLLLGYPSVESYMISGFETDAYKIRLPLGKDAKEYIADRRHIQLNKISDETLKAATYEFVHYLKVHSHKLEIDDFSDVSEAIFDEQENEYLRGKGYRIFSMLTLAFLQMGIIELE